MYSTNPDLVDVVREAYGELRLRRGEDEANRAAVGSFVSRLEPSLVYLVEGEGAREVHRGRERIETLLHHASRDWESCEFELERVERVACGKVVVDGACRARLPSGAAERFEFTALWTFRGERAQRIETFPGRARDPR